MLISASSFVALNIVLVFLFIFSGRLVYSLLPNEMHHPLALKIGVSYFSGLSLFALLYRILASHDARTGLWIASFVMLLLSSITIYRIRGHIRETITAISRRKMLLAVVVILTPIILLAVWLEPRTTLALHPSDHLASLHSGRYANIALYILEANYVPILGQNYLQSLLSTVVPFLTGHHWPLFSLYVWLCVSMIMLMIMLYGIFNLFQLSHARSCIGTAVLMFGNTALSLTHVVVIDSGSPLFYVGYTDSLVSVGTILLFLVYLRHVYLGGVTVANSVIPIVLGITWNSYAPQNVVVAVALIGLITGYSFWKSMKYGGYLVLMGLFTVSVYIGSFQGGFLAPWKFLDNTSIPGALKLEAGEKEFNIGPAMTGSRPDRHIPKTEWTAVSYYRPPLVKETDRTTPRRRAIVERLSALYTAAYTFESNLFTAIRLTFFPLMGLILTGYLGSRRKRTRDVGHRPIDLRHLFWVSLVAFTCGFLVSFFLQIHNHKWDLSRFMFPALTICVISLVVALYRIKDSILRRDGRFTWVPAAVFTIMLFGPVSNVTLTTIVHPSRLNGPAYLSISERIKLLFSTTSTIHYPAEPGSKK